MSEQTPEPTTASDLSAGGDKPGTDYGASGGIGTAAEEETTGGSDPGGAASDPTGGPAAGGSDLNEGGGGSDPNGPAVPDEPGASEAQDGVQEAFTVAPD